MSLTLMDDYTYEVTEAATGEDGIEIIDRDIGLISFCLDNKPGIQELRHEYVEIKI
jgi:hypothetical protein